MVSMAAPRVDLKLRVIGPVVLLGPPGAGQGPQAKEMAARYGIPQISTGHILPHHRDRGTELGKRAQAIMERGELVPDQLLFDVVACRLVQADCCRGFILDGFPRTTPQAEWLDSWLAKNLAQGTPALVVVRFAVAYNELLRRLSGRRSCPACGRIFNVYFQPPRVADACDVDGTKLVTRKDDAEAVVAERLKTYERQTLPLVEYYRQRGRLREIDGDRAVGQVMADVFAAVEHGRL